MTKRDFQAREYAADEEVRKAAEGPGGGGFAFACLQSPGVTLRDYFAAAALTGLLAAPGPGALDAVLYAKDAYRFADALLAERLRNIEGGQSDLG